jgi:ribonuclease T2
MALALALCAGVARAQESKANQPGQFDFYIFALQWLPSLCQGPTKYVQTRGVCAGAEQAFLVKGLWPQYEKGFPEFCQNSARELDRKTVSGILDLMRDPNLITYEWQRHGTCTGLSAGEYFSTVRKASEMVKIPVDYRGLKSTKMVMPVELDQAFIGANEGLTQRAIVLTCDKMRLHDVRICLTKDLGFRDCPESERKACDNDNIILPGLGSE